MQWLIETVSEVGDTIFDPFMGSGSTGVAAIQTGRHFIGCEISAEYFAIAEKRIKSAVFSPNFFTPSNNRLHLDVGDSPAQKDLFTLEAGSAEGKSPKPAPRR
jgi:tRNA/tmRNA/rRNA uracil-C5-methylase (TrmA/RlmC/RlmD family)